MDRPRTPMKIALDYDGTYTEDPQLWDAFIAAVLSRKGDIRIVTVRDPDHDRTEPLIELEKYVPVIYTRGVAKAWWCSHFTGGWRPDIWIDDKPQTILTNSTLTPEQLVEWRAARNH